MKKLFFVASLLLSATSVFAASLTAPSLADVLARVERAKFSPRGHGLLYGHESIESCVYAAPGILVFDHYCYPAKNYEARALTIWSKELGEVELYEQDLGGGSVRYWRDVRINQFPENVQHMFSFDFEAADYPTINFVFKKFEELDNPGCWSSSIDFNTGKPDSGCYQADIRDLPDWSKETSALVLNDKAWNTYYGRILAHVQGGAGGSR